RDVALALSRRRPGGAPICAQARQAAEEPGGQQPVPCAHRPGPAHDAGPIRRRGRVGAAALLPGLVQGTALYPARARGHYLELAADTAADRMTMERDRLADSAAEERDPQETGVRQFGDFRWPPRISGQHRAPRNRLHARLLDILAGRPGKNGEARIARWIVLVWLVAIIILVANDSGRIFFDTKLGVDIDPVGLYARLWHLWNPSEWFGTLQDQYIGYAVPMGPFYLIGHLLHFPVWFTERLWLATLITVGFTGIVKLAQALGIGTERSRVVAGVAYALWPTFTILIGSTSAGLLPGLLAPWAVLPLVSAARG